VAGLPIAGRALDSWRFALPSLFALPKAPQVAQNICYALAVFVKFLERTLDYSGYCC